MEIMKINSVEGFAYIVTLLRYTIQFSVVGGLP